MLEFTPKCFQISIQCQTCTLLVSYHIHQHWGSLEISNFKIVPWKPIRLREVCLLLLSMKGQCVISALVAPARQLLRVLADSSMWSWGTPSVTYLLTSYYLQILIKALWPEIYSEVPSKGNKTSVRMRVELRLWRQLCNSRCSLFCQWCADTSIHTATVIVMQ